MIFIMVAHIFCSVARGSKRLSSLYLNTVAYKIFYFDKLYSFHSFVKVYLTLNKVKVRFIKSININFNENLVKNTFWS